MLEYTNSGSVCQEGSLKEGKIQQTLLKVAAAQSSPLGGCTASSSLPSAGSIKIGVFMPAFRASCTQDKGQSNSVRTFLAISAKKTGTPPTQNKLTVFLCVALTKKIHRTISPQKEEVGKFLVEICRLPWHARRDSNPQHSEPESDALSIELRAHLLTLI